MCTCKGRAPLLVWISGWSNSYWTSGKGKTRTLDARLVPYLGQRLDHDKVVLYGCPWIRFRIKKTWVYYHLANGKENQWIFFFRTFPSPASGTLFTALWSSLHRAGTQIKGRLASFFMAWRDRGFGSNIVSTFLLYVTRLSHSSLTLRLGIRGSFSFGFLPYFRSFSYPMSSSPSSSYWGTKERISDTPSLLNSSLVLILPL